MIEKIVFDYLKKELDIPVYTEYPKEPPLEYVIIEKTGGGLDDHVHSATIAVQSYATSLFKTAELNKKIKDKMLHIISIDKICNCELNTDYDYPDTKRNLYRYQAVFNLTYLE